MVIAMRVTNDLRSPDDHRTASGEGQDPCQAASYEGHHPRLHDNPLSSGDHQMASHEDQPPLLTRYVRRGMGMRLDQLLSS